MSPENKAKIRTAAEMAHVAFVAHNWQWAPLGRIPRTEEIEEHYLAFAKSTRRKVKDGEKMADENLGRLIVTSKFMGYRMEDGTRMVLTEFGIETGYVYK